MTKNTEVGNREVWLCWKDEEDKSISGYVWLIEQTPSYLKFKTARGNIITISYSRLVKMKERGEQ